MQVGAVTVTLEGASDWSEVEAGLAEVFDQIVDERQRSIVKYGRAPEDESYTALLLLAEHAMFKAKQDYYTESGEAASRQELLKVLNLGVAALRSAISPR